MTGLIKSFLRKLGLRRYRVERWHFRLDGRFPTRFLPVWFSNPLLFFRWLQNTLARRTMLALPHLPGEVGYELVKLAMILGVRLTRDADRPHLAIAWQDITVSSFSLESVPRRPAYFINSRCRDIGKDRIETVFESVFGYSLRIDPTTHRGLCVRKSVLNARHDGVILNCPIPKPDPGCVYQHLVNNQFDDQFVLDLRTVFYRSTIPLVYRKFRPIKTRFADRNGRVELARPEDVYAPEERELILRFCRAFELDYGGLDVLRDVDNGRLYIVDVNTTPFGPPYELSSSGRRRALARLAAAFHDQFIAGFPQLVRERTAPV